MFASCAPLFIADSLCGSTTSPCRDCPVPVSAFPGSGTGYLLHLAVFRAWVFASHLPTEQSPLGKLFQAETAAAPGQGTAWGKSGFFSKNPPSEEFVPERWRMEIPMGSAPACLTDSPQHPSGWYSGCYNEFLGLTICWDNDFRCTGHSYAPALLQHLLLPC